MKTLPFTKIRSFVLILALVVLSCGVGYRLGEHKTTRSTPSAESVINREKQAAGSVDFSLFWDVWNKLHASYIDKNALNAQAMVWGAISGMVNALDDPYTVFLPPKENKDFKEDLGGQFEGIGAQLGLKEGRVMVVAPLKGMPAEKAGILAGDIILKVNNEDTTGWTVPEAVTKIRGPKGSSVTLSMFREQKAEPLEFTVKRDTIVVASVESWVKPLSEISEISGIQAARALPQGASIAYIRLSRFGDLTNDEWDKAVAALLPKLQTVKGLVFDLRNNPGGYLEGAVYIGSEFIKSGTVVSQVNSNGTKEEYPVVRKGKLLDVPLVVLVNKGSASAAEIVAGALRDFKRAKVVGEVTFGKGSVQTPEDLPGGAGLHITTGKWLLPLGDSIQKVGVTPDELVPMADYTATADAQLEKAIELLVR